MISMITTNTRNVAPRETTSTDKGCETDEDK